MNITHKRILSRITKLAESMLGYKKESAKQLAISSVWEGDPYGWSSGAKFTISVEDGLPHPYSADFYAFWEKVFEDFEENHWEQINGGVLGVY